MTRIDEIRKAILAKEQHEDEVRRWAATLARQFGEGFRDYLGLPNSYPTIDGPNRLYIEYFKFDQDTEEIGTDPVHVMDSLLISYDGLMQFGMGVILDRAEGVFPKKRYLFLVECQKDNEKLGISVGKRPRVACLPADTPAGYDLTPSFEILYGIIMERLNSRIGDEQQTRQIGFDTRPV
jgi:hypothetical protein